MWMPELHALVMPTPGESELWFEKALRNWRRLGGMALVKSYHTESPRKVVEQKQAVHHGGIGSGSPVWIATGEFCTLRSQNVLR